MRYMLLSIFVLLATQPLQASFCDMCAEQSKIDRSPTNHIQTKQSQAKQSQAKHGSSQHSMSDSDIHAGMLQAIDAGSDNQMMDCCDDKPATTERDCSAMALCGASAASMAGVNPAIFSVGFASTSDPMSALSQVPPNQFSSPPFRPPIS